MELFAPDGTILLMVNVLLEEVMESGRGSGDSGYGKLCGKSGKITQMC